MSIDIVFRQFLVDLAVQNSLRQYEQVYADLENTTDPELERCASDHEVDRLEEVTDRPQQDHQFAKQQMLEFCREFEPNLIPIVDLFL